MYSGAEPQPNMKQYCSIKVLEYGIHTADPINNPDKSILQVTKLEVVKTREVRDLIIQNPKFKNFIQQNSSTKLGNPQPWKNDGKSAIKADKENRAGNAGQDPLVDIVSLTPYMSKWSIKGNKINIGLHLLLSASARVTQKGEMRTWK